jgi:hypothetical protein
VFSVLYIRSSCILVHSSPLGLFSSLDDLQGFPGRYFAPDLNNLALPALHVYRSFRVCLKATVVLTGSPKRPQSTTASPRLSFPTAHKMRRIHLPQALPRSLRYTSRDSHPLSVLHLFASGGFVSSPKRSWDSPLQRFSRQLSRYPFIGSHSLLSVGLLLRPRIKDSTPHVPINCDPGDLPTFKA